MTAEKIALLKAKYGEALVDEAIHRISEEFVQRAKAMRAVVISCSHQEIYIDEKYGGFRCCTCQQVVHPNPEGLKHGFLEYGRKRGQDDV